MFSFTFSYIQIQQGKFFPSQGIQGGEGIVTTTNVVIRLDGLFGN